LADCVVLNDGTSLVLLNDGSSCVLLTGAVITDTDAEKPFYKLRKGGEPQLREKTKSKVFEIHGSYVDIITESFKTKGLLKRKLHERLDVDALLPFVMIECVFESYGGLKRILNKRIETRGTSKKRVTESMRIIGNKNFERIINRLLSYLEINRE